MWSDIAAAIFGGGATGLLGSLFGKVFDFLHAKEQFRHDEKMAEVETKNLQMEINRDVVVAKQKAAAVMERAAAKTQTASYGADQRAYLDAGAQKDHPGISWLMAIVDFVRGIIRPFTTVYLVVCTSYITYALYEILRSLKLSVKPDQVYELFHTAILAVFYLTFTAVGWWFGSRSKMTDVLK